MLVLLAVGIACLFAGQMALQSPGLPPMGLKFLVPTLGGLLLVLLAFSAAIARRLPGRLAARVAAGDGAARPAAGNPLLFVASLVASATAAVIAGDQKILQLPILSIGLWMTAIVVVLVGASAFGRRAGRLPRAEVVALLVIAGAALAARILRLGEIPWLLSGDEASVGLSAREFLQGVWNNPFGIAWYSFPALFFVIPAASIGILGQTIEALRLPAAMAGTLTVVGLYFYARTALGRWLAVFSATYLAFFHFHIHFSRIGLNNIWDGLFLVLFSYLLWRAWTEEKGHLFAWAGLTLGLGLYFYTSTRIVIVLLGLWLFIALVRERTRVLRLRTQWVILGIATIVIALPQIVFFAHHPGDFAAPMVRVSLLGPWLEQEMATTGLPGWRILAEQMALSAGAFTFNNLRHWYAIDHPMLLPIPATLFLLGLGLALWRAKDLRYTWILLCLGGVVIAGGLSESSPASQRYILAAPIVAVVVTLPLVEAAASLARFSIRVRILGTVAAIAVLLTAVGVDLRFYFADYTPSHRFSDRNTETAQDLATWLNQQPASARPETVYFFGLSRMNSRSISTLPYLAPQDVVFVDVGEPLNGPPPWVLDGLSAFLFLPQDEVDPAVIQAAYPGGQTRVRLAANGDPLYTLYIAR